MSKSWTNFHGHFWVNYPFKLDYSIFAF